MTTQRFPNEVLAKIESYLELAPGISANRGNLKTLLVYILERGYHKSEYDAKLCIMPQRRRKPQVLLARLEGPTMPGAYYWPCLCAQEFPADEDGLLKAIVYLKTALRTYRDEGVCETCRGTHIVRLKAEGMPYCERCVMNAALGASPGPL